MSLSLISPRINFADTDGDGKASLEEFASTEMGLSEITERDNYEFAAELDG